MTLKRVATVLTVLVAAFLVYMGIGFQIDPLGNATGFGLPEASWPGPEAGAFLNVKGGRDFGLALVILALLAARQSKALSWGLLAMALIPAFDAGVVLTHGGSLVAALSIHISAAVVVAAAGLLQLRVTRRESASTPSPEAGPQR